MPKIDVDIIESLVRDTYLLEDAGIVKLICATIIANRFFKDPVWVMLVAPSSGGKTALLSATQQCSGVHFLSSLTSRTLISGLKKKGQQPSYLFSVQNGIIVFKDFTTLLTEHAEERSAIMGQLREVYDGDFSKSFGTGEKIEWKGHVGILAGATNAIYAKRRQWAAMGERFILYSIDQPDRVEVGFKAVEKFEAKHRDQEAIQLAFKKYIDEEIKIPEKLPDIYKNTGLVDDLVYLVEFATRARSPVERDERSFQKEIIGVTPPEMPARFLIQLSLMAAAMMVMNNGNELTPEYRRILYKLAFDSIDEDKRKCLAYLYIYHYEPTPTSDVATILNRPTNSIHRHLEELNALEVVERHKMSGNRDSWLLTKKYTDIIGKYEEFHILPTVQVQEKSVQTSPVPASDPVSVPLDTQANIQFDEVGLDSSVADAI